MVVILDYGIGNLRSVQKAFEQVGTPAVITADLQRIAETERLVLPGVGAFGDCIQKFDEAGLREPVMEHLRKEKPFLGICVGMQMLFTTSYENGVFAGLNVLEGEVVRFPQQAGYKVPHMGWNTIRAVHSSPLWEGLPSPWFYFVHSYYCVPRDPSVVAVETEYGRNFCSGIQRGRLLATQFHPEKSQATGLELLRRFTVM